MRYSSDPIDFDAIAQRLIAACPVERPELPKPTMSRATWLADRADRQFTARGVDHLGAHARIGPPGRLQQFAKGGFKDDPLAYWPQQWPLLAG